MSTVTPAITTYAGIPGWFNWLDRRMFDTLLTVTDDSPGALVELGAYLGRSAVVIGDHRAPGERFVVVDLFGTDEALGESATELANRRENRRSYKTLSRQKFEDNYRALHEELPEIVQGLSSEIVEHVEPGSARFIHVDASHLYGQVAIDAQNAKALLRTDGVVVFDDFRAEHTPGVAAAVWAAVANDGLVPFALTPRKFYGTFGSSAEHLAAVRALVESDTRCEAADQEIFGHTVIRLKARAQPPKVEPAPLTDEALDQLSEKLARRMLPRLTKELTRVPKPAQPASRIARDYLPPALTRAIVSRRRRRSSTRLD